MLAIGLALLAEVLLLLMLLTLGAEKRSGSENKRVNVVTLQADSDAAEASEQDSPEPEQRSQTPPAQSSEEPLPRPATAPTPSPPAEPIPSPPTQPAPPVPTPAIRLPPNEAPRSTSRPAPSARPVYGPPDRGRPSHLRDTERVGTAPNGEPLYAAAWYREPRREDLGAYLSAARGPGWGLIACRTVADYRVEDCVGLAEYPEGSQIMRAVLAAAWEFRVRPPRLGGRPLVGTWVRIRIDYAIDRR